MPSRRLTLLALTVAVGVWLAAEALLAAGGFEFLENGSFDLRVHLAPPPEPPPREILIIDIDNASFAALSRHLGRWPWSRLLWTELGRYLHESGARLVVFDAVFSGRESEEIDAEFAQAIAAAGNVVLGFAVVQYEAEHAPGLEPSEAHEMRGAVRVEDAAGLPALSPQRYQPDQPLATLAEAARGLGCITARPDADGVLRRVDLYYRWGDHYYPSLSIAAATGALSPPSEAKPVLAPPEFRWHTLRLPISPDGRLIPRWRADAAAYPRLPLWRVVCSIFPWQCAEEKAPYQPEEFRDKIILIGASALGAFDVFATPVGPVTPGVLVHAAALDSLLQQRAMRVPPPWAPHALLLGMAALGAVVVWGFGSAARQVLAGAALAGAYLLTAVYTFQRLDLWLPLAAPLVTLAASFAAHNVTRYVTTGRELRQTRQTLSRYMSPEVVEHIMGSGGPEKLRGQKREITVMFSDVRNFTKMSEMRTPVEVLDILNRYLDAMTEIVFTHRGVVDKFMGDGILCYWGAFGDASSHAQLAAATAAKMVVKLEELNKIWQADGLPELNIGIGINTGDAVFGNLGAGKKIEFTVLGDTVNVASRLEALNKEFKTRVILSEATRDMLGEESEVRLLKEITIRGREASTKIFELVSVKEGDKLYETQSSPPPA
jgi:adenylate cyclase